MTDSPGIDNELIRQLARHERDQGCTDAPEIGRRIARAVAFGFRDGEEGAWENLMGLAAQGAAYYGRSVLKENRLRVKRRGSVTTISGGYALPSSVVSNGVHKEATSASDAPSRTGYVQLDFMTWAEFFLVLDALRDRRGAIDSTVTTFEEIAKLEASYPSASVGEAIVLAGFDLASRDVDLDLLQKAAS